MIDPVSRKSAIGWDGVNDCDPMHLASLLRAHSYWVGK